MHKQKKTKILLLFALMIGLAFISACTLQGDQTSTGKTDGYEGTYHCTFYAISYPNGRVGFLDPSDLYVYCAIMLDGQGGMNYRSLTYDGEIDISYKSEYIVSGYTLIEYYKNNEYVYDFIDGVITEQRQSNSGAIHTRRFQKQ